MAASGLTEDLKQQLVCPVCLEEFKEPKVLPCLHTFCKTCLEGVLVQDKDGRTWTIPCPSCRKVAKIANGNVGCLQLNFFVDNLISLVALHDSQADKLECDNCVSGDPAVSRCTPCSLFLCKFCEEAHRRGRKTKSHKLMSMSEVKLEGASAVAKPLMCKKHEEESLKLFCESCDRAICRDCTIVEHRDHKYVFAKDAYAKRVGGLRDLLVATKTQIPVLKNAVKSVADMMKCVDSSAMKCEKTVNDSINSLTKQMEDRGKNLLSEISKAKCMRMKELQTQKKELELALGSMQSSVNFTVQAIKDGSHMNLLQMIPQMASRLKELSTATWKLQPCVGDTCKFQADEHQLHEGILQFGSIKVDQALASQSTVSMGNKEEGFSYSTLCKQPIQFHIVARDYHGKKLQEGGDLFQVAVQLPGQQDAPVIGTASDNGDGTYTFTFNPQVAGLHRLSVTLNGQVVKGAPLVWNVETWALTQVLKESGAQFSNKNMTVRSTVLGYQNISGTCGFSRGRHLWKVNMCSTLGHVAVGIIGAEQRAKGKLTFWNRGNQWMLSNGQKYQAADGFGVQSSITSLATGDVLELLLDCEKGKLSIYNQRSGKSDSFEDIDGEVFPAFFLYYMSECVSLLV